jgi:hypothetical protein
MVHDQISWSKPLQGQLKDASVLVEDLVDYATYLKETYPEDDEDNGEQNKAI